MILKKNIEEQLRRNISNEYDDRTYALVAITIYLLSSIKKSVFLKC